MSAVTGIGLGLLLLICVSRILNFYGISLSIYGPYLAFVIFIVILSFILPHDSSLTVNNVTNVPTSPSA
jgi:uncharacterized membrane protein YkgB